MTASKFDPYPIFEALLRHKVRFVVIGGIAAQLRGAPVTTFDVDICCERTDENLERLASALRELEARLRGPAVPEDLPFRLDAPTLKAGDAFTFATRHGPLDVLGLPGGSEGYEAMVATSSTVSVDDLSFRIASIDDLIAMKRRADRPKDRAMVEELAALRERLDERGDPHL